MNRDRYLSKAKDICTGEWVIGYFMEYSAFDNKKEYKIVSDIITSRRIDPSTLCQCTGYRDSKGELIFEGDKLLCGGIMDLDILWDNGIFCLIDDYTQSKILINKINENVKIIGNKFDEEGE